MDQAKRIRVMIVDDHSVVRSGLAAFLQAFADMELIGEAKSGEEAIARCAELEPDVVLMDLVMPGVGGVAATRAIHQAQPGVRIIALTSFGSDDLVQQALQAGATGYLLKDVSHVQLAEAIRAVHAGRPALAPQATEALIRAATQPPAPGADLTPRERQVLAVMAEGLSNPQIALRLCVTEATAKAHVSSIIAKLGVSSRTEAVALALRHGLV